jgi:hypothetical protein
MKNNDPPIVKTTGARPFSTTATMHQTRRDIGPSKNEIARKAYSIYQARGCPQGLDLQHWLEAETQVIGMRNFGRLQN